MDLGKIGIWAMLEAMTAPETLDFAKTIEKHGYKTLWIPEGPGRDPFAHAAYLLSHTESLAIATGIANIWARDAAAMASASRTVAEISEGRFILGIVRKPQAGCCQPRPYVRQALQLHERVPSKTKGCSQETGRATDPAPDRRTSPKNARTGGGSD